MITVQTLGSSSKGNCYQLKSGGRSLLLECGLPFSEIQKGINFEVSMLDGCLVTHAHKDHCQAIHSVMRAGINVYATEDTFEWAGVSSDNHRKHVVVTGKYYGAGEQCSDKRSRPSWTIRAFETVHDVSGSCGFIVEDAEGYRLLFLTDTAYCRYVFPPMDCIMIEANFGADILKRNVESGLVDQGHAKRVYENHMGIERVIIFLGENDLRRCQAIHLLHLSDGNSDAELFKRMVQECTGVPTYVEG